MPTDIRLKALDVHEQCNADLVCVVPHQARRVDLTAGIKGLGFGFLCGNRESGIQGLGFGFLCGNRESGIWGLGVGFFASPHSLIVAFGQISGFRV